MKKRKLIYRMLALLLLALISMNIQVPQAQAATKFLRPPRRHSAHLKKKTRLPRKAGGQGYVPGCREK